MPGVRGGAGPKRGKFKLNHYLKDGGVVSEGGRPSEAGDNISTRRSTAPITDGWAGQSGIGMPVLSD
jgi:hypothetical protein